MLPNLSIQAYAILILMIAQFLITYKYTGKFNFIIFIFIAIIGIWNTYNMNCLHTGNCETFAWIIVVLTLIGTIGLYLSMEKINSLVNKKNE